MSEPARRAPKGRRVRGLAAALLLPLVASCATPRPELLRRYASYEVGTAPSLVDVTLFSTPAPGPGGGPPLLELSKSAQAELVEALAERTRSSAELLSTLALPSGASTPRVSGTVDRTRFRRRLVVSAENLAAGPRRAAAGSWRMSPGARISRLRIAVGLEDSVGRFRSWDRFGSRYETVDLGNMSFRQERDLGLDLDVRPGNVVGEADRIRVSSKRSSSLDEKLPLSRRYVSTGTLRPDSLILLQEGAVGTDLTGNSVIEVEIDVADAGGRKEIVAFDGLFDESGRARSPESVRVDPVSVIHPRKAEDVTGELRFEAVVRAVGRDAGDATWAEGDDRARYLVQADRTPERVVLIPSEELRVHIWQLVTPDSDDFLLIETGTKSEPVALQLGSAGEAFELLRWLRRTGASEVGRRGLYLGDARERSELTSDGAERLEVRVFEATRRPGDPRTGRP